MPLASRCFVMGLLAFLPSCATTTFWAASTTCESDLPRCEQDCRARDRGACRALNVHRAELIGSGLTEGMQEYMTPRAMRSLLQAVEETCQGGVERACKARDSLKIKVDEQAAQQQKKATAAEEIQKRNQKIEAIAREAEGLAPNAIGVHGATEHVHGLLRIGQLDLAEREANVALSLARREEADRAARAADRAAREAKKREAEDIMRDIEEAKQFCGADAPTQPPSPECLHACDDNPTSARCVTLGMTYAYSGKGTHDPAKGRRIIEHACEQGSQVGCAAKETIDKRDQGKKDQTAARAAIPGLFSKCRALKAKALSLRSQVIAAARARDRGRLEALQPQMEDVSSQINALGNEVNVTIATATGQEEPEYARMIEEGRRACLVVVP